MKQPISKPSRASLRKVFRELVWPRRGILLVGLVLIIINRMAGLVLPGSTKVLIDDVIANQDYNMLKWLLIVVSIALVVQTVSSFSLTQILSVEAQRLIAKLRAQIQQHVLYLPTRFFDNEKSGALVSRIMNDVEGVRNLVGTGLVQLVGGLLTAVVSVFILLYINATLTAYVLGPMVLFGIISMLAFKKIRPIFRNRQVILSDVTGRLTETINGIRVVKGFNAEGQEVRSFEAGVDKLFRNIRKSLLATSLVTSSSALLLGLASVGIMGMGGYMIMGGQLSIGDFLAFTLYLGFMIAPIVQMSNIGTQLTEALAGLDRVEELLSNARETDNPERTIVLKEVQGHIRFRDVTFGYEPGNPVLHGISFEALPGSVTALVGSSGSGKTTIAGLAASFLQPQSGWSPLTGTTSAR
jgi:ABC-type bacteriocin/lantibiotic exporter with double-glycine peptidase domain